MGMKLRTSDKVKYEQELAKKVEALNEILDGARFGEIVTLSYLISFELMQFAGDDRDYTENEILGIITSNAVDAKGDA